MHVVCAWIGNTELIAAKHYLLVTDDDFMRATRGAAKGDARMRAKCGAATSRTVWN
jgi:hypothetical protein